MTIGAIHPVYTGLAAPAAPGGMLNGARGNWRDQTQPLKAGVFHLWVSPEDGPERYLQHLRTPQLPAPNTRTFQSRTSGGQWLWERPDGTPTTSETQAKRYTGRACSVYRSGAPAYPLTPYVSPMPWCYGAGYLSVTGIDGVLYNAADPQTHKANANPPWNDRAWSVCIPGRYQTVEQWHDETSSKELEACVTAVLAGWERFQIPMRWLVPEAIKDGERDGWTGHGELNKAYDYKYSNHGDPGAAFPSAFVIEMAHKEMNMARIVNIKEIPPDWPNTPCTYFPGLAIDHGGVLEFVSKEVAERRLAQKSVKGSTSNPDAIERKNLSAYRLGYGTLPPSAIAVAEFMP